MADHKGGTVSLFNTQGAKMGLELCAIAVPV